MKQGACYIRVSTAEQTEYSPESQLRLIREYAGKNGIIIEEGHIYRDEGLSGRTTEKRPAFNKMIAKAKQGGFEVILVYSTSRFARNLEDSIVYKSMLLREYGVEVISVTQPPVDKKTDMLTNAIYSVMDEWYSLDLADNVKRGMTQKALTGGHQSTAPYGYKRKHRGAELCVVDEEAEIVRFIFKRFISGTGLWTLAGILNQNSARTKKGNDFNMRSLLYILRNPVYKGYTRWTPTGRTGFNFNNPDCIITKAGHEPIINEETFDRAQEMLNTPQVERNHFTGKNSHWLSGLLKCGSCGATMAHNSRGDKKRAVWQCSRYYKGSCRATHYLSVGKSERCVLSFFYEISGILPERRYTAYSENITTSQDFYKRERERLAKKLSRAKNGFLEGIFTAEEFKSLKETIGKDMALLDTGYIDTEVKEEYCSIYEALAGTLPAHKKAALLRSVVDKIVYDKQNSRLLFYFNV